jgi:hypothetical protein
VVLSILQQNLYSHNFYPNSSNSWHTIWIYRIRLLLLLPIPLPPPSCPPPLSSPLLPPPFPGPPPPRACEFWATELYPRPPFYFCKAACQMVRQWSCFSLFSLPFCPLKIIATFNKQTSSFWISHHLYWIFLSHLLFIKLKALLLDS